MPRNQRLPLTPRRLNFYYVALSLVLRKLGREKESEAAMAKVAELQKQSVERVRDLVHLACCMAAGPILFARTAVTQELAINVR